MDGENNLSYISLSLDLVGYFLDHRSVLQFAHTAKFTRWVLDSWVCEIRDSYIDSVPHVRRTHAPEVRFG